MSMITYDDFAKVEIKVGQIRSAEKIPDTDKLLRLEVDFGMKAGEKKEGEEVTSEVPDVRQIVSGIAASFPDPLALVGKKCMFVTNLEPRKIRGFESNGMLFAVGTPGGAFSLLEPKDDIAVGTKAK